jgi:hypothetical protein
MWLGDGRYYTFLAFDPIMTTSVNSLILMLNHEMLSRQNKFLIWGEGKLIYTVLTIVALDHAFASASGLVAELNPQLQQPQPCLTNHLILIPYFNISLSSTRPIFGAKFSPRSKVA